jgi:GT2 family glycosyltransferase
MNTHPDVSVVIVSWNTADTLVDCLRSIVSDRTAPSCEIIVVDNASSDGSVDILRRDFRQVMVIANTDNKGFAAANNQGLRVAHGRHLVLLNPDTVVRPGALASLVAFMDAHADAGIAGPHLLNVDGSTQPSGRPTPTVSTELRDIFGIHHLTRGERFWGRQRDLSWPQTVDSVSGACLLIRREAMDAIGLLDEGFFMYFEETDWCVRAWQQGWKVYYVPQAEVVHYTMGSTGRRVEPFLIRAYFNSRMHYFSKHYGIVSCGVLRATLLMTSLAKLGILTVASLFRHDSDKSRQGQVAHRLIVALCLGRDRSE